jgi:hypothetical protein
VVGPDQRGRSWGPPDIARPCRLAGAFDVTRPVWLVAGAVRLGAAGRVRVFVALLAGPVGEERRRPARKQTGHHGGEARPGMRTLMTYRPSA